MEPELWVDLQEHERVRAFLCRTLEQVEGQVVVPQRQMDLRQLVGRYVLATCFEIPQQLQG